MIIALFILVLIVFVVSLIEGYVDMGSTKRLGRWIGMRMGESGGE
jgi:hypothetical protein